MQAPSRWLWPVLVGVVLLGLAVAGLLAPTEQWLSGFRDWLQSQGTWGAVCFGCVYVFCTVLFVPGSILTLGAGYVYGPVQATALVSTSSTIGAALAFLLGRYLARDRVRALVQARPKFAAVDAAVAARGGWIVLLLRFSPLFPFNFLNYALGLTGIRFIPYVLASWIGMLPGTLLYVLLGHAGRQTLASEEQAVYWIVAALATLAATFLITRVALRALSLPSHAPPRIL